jgi:Flp pilus assembly protein protease CpaA
MLWSSKPKTWFRKTLVFQAIADFRAFREIACCLPIFPRSGGFSLLILSSNAATLMLWLPFCLLGFACYCDLRWREIPDAIPLLLLLTALLAVGLGWISLSFAQLFLGVLVGFVVSAVFGLLGGLGGGDVKLVSALGAWLGPIALLVVLFWTALFGMLMATGFWILGKKDLPYVPAIAFGFGLVVAWPDAILRLLKLLAG